MLPSREEQKGQCGSWYCIVLFFWFAGLPHQERSSPHVNDMFPTPRTEVTTICQTRITDHTRYTAICYARGYS